MVKPFLYFIATSKAKEIRAGASVTFTWGAYGKWTNFKSPVAASKKKVTYNKTSKNKAGASAYGGAGGVTVLGTHIPATAQRTISGVTRTCDVRYYKRGYTKFIRTAALKREKKMRKDVYSKAHPYQYRLQYKDKPIKDTAYSEYADGKYFAYFAPKYYDDSGQEVARDTWLPHPLKFDVGYKDILRNFDASAANNQDGRDNNGSLVTQTVRANVPVLTMEWGWVNEEQGQEIIDAISADKTNPYLLVQYFDPLKGAVVNKTFKSSERVISPFANGYYESIAVTLEEV